MDLPEFEIPLYRAKDIHSEKRLIGYLAQIGERFFIIKSMSEYKSQYPMDTYSLCSNRYDEIDPDTLAIHFTHMMDIHDNPFFAAMNPDGLGGDKIYAQTYQSTGNMSNDVFRDTVCLFKNHEVVFMDEIQGETRHFDYNYFVKPESVGIKL